MRNLRNRQYTKAIVAAVPVIMTTKYSKATNMFSPALINALSEFIATSWSRSEVSILPIVIPRIMNSAVDTIYRNVVVKKTG